MKAHMKYLLILALLLLLPATLANAQGQDAGSTILESDAITPGFAKTFQADYITFKPGNIMKWISPRRGLVQDGVLMSYDYTNTKMSAFQKEMKEIKNPEMIFVRGYYNRTSLSDAKGTMAIVEGKTPATQPTYGFYKAFYQLSFNLGKIRQKINIIAVFEKIDGKWYLVQTQNLRMSRGAMNSPTTESFALQTDQLTIGDMPLDFEGVTFVGKTSGKTLHHFNGTGQKGSHIFELSKGSYIFEMSHDGSDNFAIWLLNSEGKKIELLVNKVGNFQGSKALGVKKGDYLLDISADGKWSVKIKSPSEKKARRFASKMARNRTRPTLLNFFTLISADSGAQTDWAETLYPKYKGKNIYIFCVSDDEPEYLKWYLEQGKWNLGVLRDVNSLIHHDLEVDIHPYIILLDHWGVVRTISRGYNEESLDLVESVMDEIIDEANRAIALEK